MANKVTFNGNSMVGQLRGVLVCSPHSAGWDSPAPSARWHELGFLRSPDSGLAQAQHAELCPLLESAGAEVVHLPASPTLSLDAVYTHDPSFITDYGAILMNPGKPSRVAEAGQHGELFRSLGIPILGEIQSPATSEAGDMVWLDSKTLLIGHSYRTNAAGIAQMRDLLTPKGVEVIAAPLPHSSGPAACLHLMSLISLVEEGVALVDLPWLAVETVELLQAREFFLIEIDDSERNTLACNVLSLGERRLLALKENPKTNRKLTQHGFDVRSFSGSELCINGGGGPTCLTRPFLRV